MSALEQINRDAARSKHPHHPYLPDPAFDRLAITAILGIVAAFAVTLVLIATRPGGPMTLDWVLMLMPLLPALMLVVVMVCQRVCGVMQGARR